VITEPTTRIYFEQHVVRTSAHAVVEITHLCEKAVECSKLKCGLISVFLRHTSASLLIFENADPTAMRDLCEWLRRLAPEGDPRYTHTLEGPDDMPSHLRMVLTRTQETIPFRDGRLSLGTWQGLFLLEHRSGPHSRKLEFTVVGTT
jgi:secondary thiamine-phosphate synthase enzyme